MQMRIIYEYLKIIEFLELLHSSIYLNKKQPRTNSRNDFIHNML